VQSLQLRTNKRPGRLFGGCSTEATCFYWLPRHNSGADGWKSSANARPPWYNVTKQTVARLHFQKQLWLSQLLFCWTCKRSTKQVTGGPRQAKSLHTASPINPRLCPKLTPWPVPRRRSLERGPVPNADSLRSKHRTGQCRRLANYHTSAHRRYFAQPSLLIALICFCAEVHPLLVA
jgi:hypothetical protein